MPHKNFMFLLSCVVLLGIAVSLSFSYTRQTNTIRQEDTMWSQNYGEYRYEQVDKFNKMKYDIDSLISFTTGAYSDSLYKGAIKTTRLRADSAISMASNRIKVDSLHGTAAVKVVRLRADSSVDLASNRIKVDSLHGTAAVKVVRLRADSAVDMASNRIKSDSLNAVNAVLTNRLRLTSGGGDSLNLKKIRLGGSTGTGVGTIDSVFLSDSTGTDKDTLIIKINGKALKIFCDIGG